MEIRILDYKKVNDGLLRALVSVSVDGWIIRGLRVTQHEGRRPYIVMTKGSVLDTETGRIHLDQLVFMPPDTWRAVENVILEKFREEEKEHGSNQTAEPR